MEFLWELCEHFFDLCDPPNPQELKEESQDKLESTVLLNQTEGESPFEGTNLVRKFLCSALTLNSFDKAYEKLYNALVERNPKVSGDGQKSKERENIIEY